MFTAKFAKKTMNLNEVKLRGNAYSYKEFIQLVKNLFNQNRVTGAEQSEAKLEATKINIQRFDRIYKNTVLSEELTQTIKSIKNPQVWYLIVEGWCGDCAQIVPVVAKISEANPYIELKLVIRDENPEFMDSYLTNGGKSVPKLVCYDKQTGNEVAQWGPRPQKIQEKVKALKTSNPEISHDEFVLNVHTWYAQDKTQSIQNDFILLFS